MNQISQLAGPVVTVALVAFSIVGIFLTVFLPFFIYGIWSRARKIEIRTATMESMLTESLTEQETANKLSRQLLRSYGHEPEA